MENKNRMQHDSAYAAVLHTSGLIASLQLQKKKKIKIVPCLAYMIGNFSGPTKMQFLDRDEKEYQVQI